MVDLVPIEHDPWVTEPFSHDPFEPIPLSQTAGRVDAPWRPDQIAPPPQHLTSMANNPIAHGIGEAILSPITEAGEYVGGLMQGTIPFEPGEAIKEGLKFGSAFVGPKMGGGALAGMLAPGVKAAAKATSEAVAPEAAQVASVYKKLLSNPKWSGSYEDGPVWQHLHEMFPDKSGAQKQKVADYLHAFLEGDAKTKPVMDLGGMEAPVPKNFGTTPSIAKDIEKEGGWTLDRHVPPPEALRSGFDQPAYHSTREFEGRKLKPEDFYSTPDPELASLYAGSDYVSSSKYGAAQTLPLLLKTRDYHTVDAAGKNWQAVNSDAIREARERGAPGVRINNVWDEPHTQGNLSEPKTVFISLDPSTVRSRFAKFDPANMQLNDLLASGAAISLPASVIASKTLVPVDHNPFVAGQ